MPKHIKRLVTILIVLLVAGYAAKRFFTADSFYRFGHYRANSVAEIAAQAPAYQTPRYCRTCHAERYAQWSASNHKSVICEVCHGAGQGHPQDRKMPIPTDTRKLCTLCHEAMPGRPAAQPQVDPVKHAGDQQCIVCHNPHSPKIVAVAAKVKGDAAAGARKHSEVCAACHGPKGVSANDTWPNLAGQHPAYLARILAAYKSGDQKDIAMTPMAQGLSDADINNLAAYYGSLSCSAWPVGKGTGDVAAGKALAKNCTACHGEAGVATNPAWPILAAQKPGYLVNALKAFRAGLRKDPLMAGVARGLSDTDIANLAAYFAAQPCRTGGGGGSKP